MVAGPITRAGILFAIGFVLFFRPASALAVDCLDTASDAIESGRTEAAVPALTEAAEEGDERCSFILGMWSLSGTGVEQDPVSGSRWLSEAASEGLPVAQSHLGLLYASGWGVEKDEETAAEWYRSAAEYGDPLGQAALGAAEFLGVGVPKNRVQGYAWTSLAASRGEEKARAHLAGMEAALTTEELEQAKAVITEFRPKERPRPRRMSQWEVLRAVGMHRRPTEYERMFGFGGGGP